MHSLLLMTALAADPSSSPDYLRERFENTALAQLYAAGVPALSADDQRVAWHLTLASHAGEPIAYDQLGWNLLGVKRLLEGAYLFGLEPSVAGRPSDFEAKLTVFLKKFYGHLGNHDQVTSQKFVPAFTPEQLEAAAVRALKAGAPLGVKDEQALKAWLSELRRTLFDLSFEPLATSKTPPAGKDILTASSNTAYGRDVSLKDLEGFKEKNALNSRVVKADGKLVEQVFRAGTPDKKVPPGLYASELTRVIGHLQAAAKHAKRDQKEALTKLVRYFQTGDLKDWDAYNIAWLKANPVVDANLGFIESYVDARGQKGQWEGLINYRDQKENQIMELLAKKAQYFEDKMPWPDQYKRKKIPAPVAKAISLITAYPTPPAGINLPNEQHIREKYGSKSVLVANTMETASAIKRLPLALEFSRNDAEREDARKYSVPARKWLVAFHEVTGHASGKVDPKVKDSSLLLKEYDNTLEEARADLVALWHAFDPALAELSPEHEKIGQQMYRDFLVEGLSNLHRVEQGDHFEEDHQRGHHMTVNFLLEQGGAKQEVIADGKSQRTFWVPTDFAKMREGVGQLLTKLMVFKATGDYEGIKALVTRLGVKFDPKLRDEVVARVKAAKVPTVVLMASPKVTPKLDAKGEVSELVVRHDQPFIEQHLERTLLGSVPPAEATRLAAALEPGLDGLRKAILARAAAPAAVDAGP